jgi:hypothetical protein
LEGRDNGSRPRQLTCAAVREWDPGIGRLLQLLQDHAQWFFEELRHQFRFEGCAEDSAGTQDAEDVRWEHGPIPRSCGLSRRRFLRNFNHRCLALVMVQQIDKLCDPTLRYALHREEQW